MLKADGKPLEQTIKTPVGASNSLASPAVDMATVVGDFYVDLAGRQTSVRGILEFQLAWDNEISDYDLFVDGDSELSSRNPELRSETVKHCVKVPVKVDAFYGLPTDRLTLRAVVRPPR